MLCIERWLVCNNRIAEIGGKFCLLRVSTKIEISSNPALRLVLKPAKMASTLTTPFSMVETTFRVFALSNQVILTLWNVTKLGFCCFKISEFFMHVELAWCVNIIRANKPSYNFNVEYSIGILIGNRIWHLCRMSYVKICKVINLDLIVLLSKQHCFHKPTRS